MKIIKPNWVKHDHKGNKLSIFSIDIHPEGTKFATGGQGNDCGRVAIWNMAPIFSTSVSNDENQPKLLCQIDNHLQCVNAVRWSSSGQFLASAGDDKLIMIWTLGGLYEGRTEQYRTVSTLRTHSGDILDLAWSYNDQWLASCSVDNMIVVWNAQRWPEITKILQGHSGLVKGITWDPVGKYLASQSDDKTLRVWRASDWSEETIVDKPFEECGATTHVLRLSWSPDGQYIVSAQAMNNNGSVAKVIDRHDWSYKNDFVGHRKAIPCVRFNPNIFKYSKKKQNSSEKEIKFKPQCVLATGSRDRAIAVWITTRSRPIVVINDVFDNTVLDLSWSKTGYQLIACSSDGDVICMQFTEKELGFTYNEEERLQYLQQLYGTSFSNKNSICNRLIEDMDIMILQQKKTTELNGDHFLNKQSCQENNETKCTESEKLLSNCEKKESTLLNTSSSSSPSKPQSNIAQQFNALRLAKGPTDKQIEIKQADGRRRIIPLFIPPSNSTVPDSPNLKAPSTSTFSSVSSTESKSKILIETRDESNPPQSYGNYYYNNSNSQLNGDKKSNSEDKVDNVTIEKQKMTSNEEADAKKSEITQIVQKDDQMENHDAEKSKEATSISVNSASKKLSVATTKNITNGVCNNNANNNGSIESESSSDPEVIIKRKGVKRKNIELANASKKKPGRPSGLNQPKQSSQNSNGNGDFSSKNQNDTDNFKHNDQSKAIINDSNKCSNRFQINSSDSHKLSNFIFPPLKLSRQNHSNIKLFNCQENKKIYFANIEYPLSSSGICKFTVLLNNDICWSLLISNPIVAVSGSEEIVVCVCEDMTTHIFYILNGRRLFVPIILESPVARMVCSNKYQLLLITCDARIWLWDVFIPKVLIKGESLNSLLIDPKTSEQLSIINASVTTFSKLIVTISNGRTYVYESELSSWCLINDLNDPLNACTDLKPCAMNSLKSLSFHSKIPSRSLVNFFTSSSQMSHYGNLSFLESQVEVAKLLGSASDYRDWTLKLVQNLVSSHSSGCNTENIESRLRELCTGLLGSNLSKSRMGEFSQVSSTPKISRSVSMTINSKRSIEKVIGVNKHELLREVLSLLASNLSFQRLYLEFKDQLELFSISKNSAFSNSLNLNSIAEDIDKPSQVDSNIN